MALESHTFPSGMRVYVDHLPHSLTTQMTVNVAVGSAHESVNEAGLAHLTEHATMLGTRSFRNAGDLDEFADNHSFIANAETSHLGTRYVAEGVKIAPMLRYLGEVTTSPLLLSKPTRGELDVVRQELNNRRGEIDALSWMVRDQLHFGEPHGRPIIGTLDRLHYTNDQIRDFYEKAYRLGAFSLISVGKASMEEVLPLVERYFENSPGSWPGQTEVSPVPPAKVLPGGTYGYLVEDAATAFISITNVVPAALAVNMMRNMAPYRIASEILGSEIFDTVRVKRHLSYIGEYDLDMTNQSDAWLGGGYASVDSGNVRRGLSAINSSVARAEEISLGVIRRRVTGTYGRLMVSLDSHDAHTKEILHRLDSGREPIDPVKMVHQYTRPSTERVRKALLELIEAFETAPRVTLVSGDSQAVGGYEPAVVNF